MEKITLILVLLMSACLFMDASSQTTDDEETTIITVTDFEDEATDFTTTDSPSNTEPMTTISSTNSTTISTREPITEPLTDLSTIMTSVEESSDATTNASTGTPTTESSKSTTATTTTTTTDVPKIGPVPPAEYPNLSGDPNKTYTFDVAVIEDSADNCTSNDLKSPACESFQLNFISKLMQIYAEESDAFLNITDVSLRQGSIIVQHTVVYSYSKMSEKERSRTADQLYDSTIGGAINSGSIGPYELIDNCTACNDPEETSTICDDDVVKPERCNGSLVHSCKDNYWVCQSKCISEPDYCNNNGICWQKDAYSEPTCSCDWVDGEWYWGYKCQYKAIQTWLIIGCSCGGAVFILFVSVLIYCACARPRSSTDKNDSTVKPLVDEAPLHAFSAMSYSNNHQFPIDDDFGETPLGNSRQSRPYSYIFSNADDSAIEEVNQALQGKNRNQGNGVANKVTKPQTNGEANKRQSGGSSASAANRTDPGPATAPAPAPTQNKAAAVPRSNNFWGNLAEPARGEQIQLNPVLDHINTNEDYKIQRPRVSVVDPTYMSAPAKTNSYSYDGVFENRYAGGGHGNRPTSSSSSMNASSRAYHIPEPDYTER